MLNVRKSLVLVLALVVLVAFNGLALAGADKININKADAEALTQLKKIGPTISARIVEYRVKNGPFKSPEDIMNVKGIGQKTYEGIKDQIVVK
ncbi:MAG: helix-hairpin-helix domain-containing protein [Desulfobacterales bacterium]|nr:helix-hairpin-helix domain-containing protein [Desulfobacterales bacterium]